MLNILRIIFLSPVSLVGLSMLIVGNIHILRYFQASAIATFIYSLYQYNYLKNNNNNDLLFNISLVIFSLELIILCNLSFIWLILLFISVLLTHTVTTSSKNLSMKTMQSETTCTTSAINSINSNERATSMHLKPKLVMNLSPYEAVVFISIWSILLFRFTERMNILMNYNSSNNDSYSIDTSIDSSINNINEYSIEQCMNIVEIFTTAMLLLLMCSEAIIHILYTSIHHFTLCRWDNIQFYKNFLIKPKNSTHKPSSLLYTTHTYSIYIDIIILITTIITTFIYIIQPQLHEYNINNIFIWFLYLLFRQSGYWELSLVIYWIILIAVFIFSAYYIAKSYHWPRTCLRKIFHLLVVLLFTPTIMNNTSHLIFSICTMNSTYNSMDSTYNSMNSTYCGIKTSEYVQSRSYRWYVFVIFSLGAALNVFILFEYMRLRILSSSSCGDNNGNSSDSNSSSISTSVQSGTVSEKLAYFGTILDDYMELFLTTTASTTTITTTSLSADSSCNNSTTTTTTTSTKKRTIKALELSHISLLFGCAAPIWLYTLLLILIPYSSTSSSNSSSNYIHTIKAEQILLLSIMPYVGLVTLGIGDAAAAVIGKLYGSYYWHYLIPTGSNNRSLYQKNKRTIEGSLACLTSMCVYTFIVLYYEYKKLYEYHPISMWVLFNVATVLLWVLFIVTIVEAWTLENDNIILPILMCVLLLLCSIICF